MKEPMTSTMAPVTAPGISNKWEPEFVRLPKSGTLCAWTGLSRAKMNELILPCAGNSFKPPVRSVVLRAKGRTRGVRLVVYQSLVSYLNTCGLAEAKEGTHES